MNLSPEYNQPFDLVFDNQETAWAIRASSDSDAGKICRKLGFYKARPVIFISGGAGYMSEDDQKRTEAIIAGIARFAEEHQVTIIDGGTESGIMKMIGDTRGKAGYKFWLIGVSPLGKVSYPGYQNPGGDAFLEDSHTHFVLVDGDEWGAESQMIIDMADNLRGNGQRPAVGVLINGGKIAMQEVYLAGEHKIPMIVVEGSGRAADEISTAFRSGKAKQAILKAILQGGDIELLGTVEGPEAMRTRLLGKFTRHYFKNTKRE